MSSISNSSESSSATKAFSWGSFWRHYLFFFYFSGLYQIIIFSSGVAGGVGLRQAIYMSFLWLIPILLLPKYTKLISGAIGLVLWGTSLMTMGYLALYGQDFSQSVLYIIFESNFSESKEFLESYFKWWMVPAFIIYSLIPYVLWKTNQALYTTAKMRTVLVLTLSFVVVWPSFNRLVIKQSSVDYAIAGQMNRMEPAAPWHLVMGYMKYKKTLAAIEKNLLANENLAPLENLRERNAVDKNTLVLVIGESTNRQRMSLYGYNRKTTPMLDALKGELLVFDNVYSPRPYTIETLQQVLTFADQKNPDLYLERPTLINMMKQAGYKTYWITNQQTQTKRNTMLTTFSRQADEQVYLNNNRSQDSSQYDGVVIKPFEKILKSAEAKKFIVIHLLGTHRKYHYRYPDDFAAFEGKNDVPKWLDSDQVEEYNEYDNAILYNDYVVAQLIKTLKENDDKGMLTYFSDHGEEVYDNPEKLFAGRNEGSPSSPMYTVPFIIWCSDAWQKENVIENIDSIVHRAYSTSDFIYTWSDLVGIKFKGDDLSRSLVSPLFSQHPIWIGDPSRPKSLRDLRVEPFSDIEKLHKKKQAVQREKVLGETLFETNNDA